MHNAFVVKDNVCNRIWEKHTFPGKPTQHQEITFHKGHTQAINVYCVIDNYLFKTGITP